MLRKLVVLFLLPAFALAQAHSSMAPPSGGGLKGKVVDASDNAPVEFSNVAVYKSGDDKIVAIESSSTDGSFVVRGLPNGVYSVKVSFVGYETNSLDSIMVGGGRPVDLGPVKISPVLSRIDEVVVKGEKSLYENKIDRKVFNVDKAIISQSGTATDVLQQVPSVSVDQDGVVSLRGSENVNILINGRPTLIDKTVLLQQIAANSIEKIEVITNPSVKYDSEGTSGIINIVLKQGVAQGLHGTVMINAGTNDEFNLVNKYNGSVNINYNPGKYNLFGSYSYRNNEGYFSGETKRSYLSDSSLFSEFRGLRMRESHMLRLGIDYFVTPKLTLGLNGSINVGTDADVNNDKYVDSDHHSNPYLRYSKSGEGNEDNTSKELAAYLTQKFNSDGHELRLDYSFGLGEEDESAETFYDTTFMLISKPTLRRTEFETGYDYRKNQIFSADYALPINDKMKLELGGKLNIRDNQDTVLANYTLGEINAENLPEFKEDRKSFNYKYHEDITSIYSTYSLMLGNFSVMAGAKTEFANYRFNIVQLDTTISNYFFSFIPSLHMVQKLNDKNEVNLSYSRRINRPRGRMLSPIPDYSNLQSIRIGNPDLKPEYTNSFELGYTFKPEKITLQPTAFYRIIENRFTGYRIPNPVTKVDTITTINIGTSTSYGFDMAITYQPFKFWNLNISGSLFQYTIEASNLSPEKQRFSYNGKIMSNTMLPVGLAVQLSAFYRSPFITTQGESDPFYSVNLGLRKDLLKGKLTASLTYNDIFNTMRFAMKNVTLYDTAEMWRKRESSTIMAGLTYKFGKAPKNGKRQQQNNRQQDENAAGDDMMY